MYRYKISVVIDTCSQPVHILRINGLYPVNNLIKMSPALAGFFRGAFSTLRYRVNIQVYCSCESDGENIREYLLIVSIQDTIHVHITRDHFFDRGYLLLVRRIDAGYHAVDDLGCRERILLHGNHGHSEEPGPVDHFLRRQ